MVSEKLLCDLIEIKAIKFGEFKLKSGCISPIYFDFRCIISYPNILRMVADEMWGCVNQKYLNGDFTYICGVPFTALPIASCMSILKNVPMLMKRKEAKSHGTGNLVEGVYETGIKCLIVEDVVTSGTSVYETGKALRDLGIVVSDVVVLLDRQQGAVNNLKNSGINLHSLLKVENFLDKALKMKFIDTNCFNQCMNFFKGHQIENTSLFLTNNNKNVYATLEHRIQSTKCEFNKILMKIMLEKKSNLCVAVDMTKSSDILDITTKIGEHICMLKTHIDVIDDFTEEFLIKLKKLSKQFNFLLFEDRKFADIGATVKLQYQCCHYKINEYFDVVNAHVFPGPNIIDGIYEGRSINNQTACILLAEMSSSGNLFDDRIKSNCMDIANKWPNFVSGFVCQNRIDTSGDYLHYTPGVSLSSDNSINQIKTDGLGQQYKTPQMAINNGADIIIIGRAITKNIDPKLIAQKAQIECFNAFINRNKPT